MDWVSKSFIQGIWLFANYIKPPCLIIFRLLLVTVSEVGILKVCEILKNLVIHLRGRSLSVANLVAADQEKTKCNGYDDLSGDTADDELAACLVYGSFIAAEAVRSNNISDTVGKENKGSSGCSLSVPADVGSGHLESNNEGSDKGGALSVLLVRFTSS